MMYFNQVILEPPPPPPLLTGNKSEGYDLNSYYSIKETYNNDNNIKSKLKEIKQTKDHIANDQIIGEQSKSTQEGNYFAKFKNNQRKMIIKFLLLKLFLIIALINVKPSEQALLTNIYGKKLSELKGDLSHRFLLLTSPYSPTESSITPISQHQQSLALSASSSSSSSSSSSPSQIPGNNAQSSSSSVSNNQSPTAATDNQPEPLPNPLALAWANKQQQQSNDTTHQPGAPQRSLRLMMAPQANNSNLDPMLESLTTDFPNPNINNLGHEITKILHKFFLHGYDKRVRPNYSGPPALVNISFHIIGISSVDEVQMDFTTDFYFRQKWYDPRLVFDPVGGIDELCVGSEFSEKIWLPDTFFANEKMAIFHRATTDNTFIRIGSNGRVYRSIRLTVTCSCPMDLQYFPMDRQRCKIEIESYGYNTRDIDYRWERGDASVSLNTKIELPQFKILGFKMGHEIQNLSSGDYIRLYCEIHFVRSMGYYLFQIYIPASLIVMISWVSFWLHRNATPARVALGVTTVLTMTTLMSSTNAALPKISYVKSIDVFLGTCFVMVFAALLEYASVGYIGKRIAMKRKRLQDLQQMQQHHQKVCVAAAASAAAAAAAAAAHEGQNFSPGLGTSNKSGATESPWSRFNLSFSGGGGGSHTNNSQTLNRRATATTTMTNATSKTLQRGRASSSARGSTGDGLVGPGRSSFGLIMNKDTETVADFHRKQQLHQQPTTDSSRTPLLAASAAAMAAAAAANQHAQATEFEVNQTHDLIRICGLTPSSIDKHSRVVFPICFVCFNLMYWIIYGHISQQIEDKGPPLIPFVKS